MFWSLAPSTVSSFNLYLSALIPRIELSLYPVSCCNMIQGASHSEILTSLAVLQGSYKAPGFMILMCSYNSTVFPVYVWQTLSCLIKLSLDLAKHCVTCMYVCIIL